MGLLDFLGAGLAGGEGNMSPQQMGLLQMAASAAAANPPQAASRLPLAKPSLGYILGQAAGGYGQGYGAGLQQQQTQAKTAGQNIQNQLDNLTLQGYLRMQQGLPGAGPPTAPGMIAGAMVPPPPSAGNAPPEQSSAAMGGYGNLGKPPSAASPSASGGAAPPLFNIGDLMSQYRIAAATPGMGAVAGNLLTLINKGAPEGTYIGTDGGIYNRPGLTSALGQQKSAQEWATVAPQEAINSAKPVELRGPGSVYFNPLTRSGVQVANEINSVNPNTGAKQQQFVPIGVTPFGPQAANMPSVPSPGQTPSMSAPGPRVAPSMTPSPAANGGPAAAATTAPGTAVPFMTAIPPAREKAETSLGEDFGTTDKKQYDAANQTLGTITSMVHSIDAMNATGGWMSPGAGADVRAEIGKWANSLAAVTGEKPPFDANTIGNWEALTKNTKIAGLQTVNSYLGGSREAASVIQGATSAVPSAENTPLGFRLVASGIEQAAQRTRDLYNYKASLLQQNQGLVGAESNFNKANPPSLYTKRAIANAIPDWQAQDVLAHPERAKDFDAKYGSGMAQFIANGGRTQLGAAGMQ